MNGYNSDQTETSVMGKSLFRMAVKEEDPGDDIISRCVKYSILTEDQVQQLLRLYDTDDEIVKAAFEVYQNDKDEEELMDTLMRIVRLRSAV